MSAAFSPIPPASKSTVQENRTLLCRLTDKERPDALDYYGFTDEELDFIINYDITYRMGREVKDSC